MQLVVYCAAAYRLVQRHAMRIENAYSSLDGIDLRWPRTVIADAAVAAVAWIASAAVDNPLSSVLNTSLPPLIILMLGVLAQRQRPLAKVPAEEPPQSQPAIDNLAPQLLSDATPKYAKSGLTAERMRDLANQLGSFMSREKAFLENGLTLDQLSARTGIATHQLSQLLSQHLGASFFEYINRLRVEEVKRCLTDPAFAGQSVLGIGLAAGFNSKAAFNAAFKRFTGTTPTLFRASQS
jgi:AraC-like DNA-binding protein